MSDFIIKKIVSTLLVFMGAGLFTYGMMMFAPGDPALEVAIARYRGENQADANTVEWIRQKEGLDRPFLIQYLRWMKNVLCLDLGNSLVEGTPVTALICSRFSRTLTLAIAAVSVALLIALPLGLLAGFRQGTWMDSAGVSIGVMGAAMPNYWLGLVLIIIFAVRLRWLPCFGHGGWSHLILPAFTLGTALTAYTTRILRSAIIESLGAEYLLALRARGICSRLTLGKHILKNALIPVVTVMGIEFGMILEGAVMTETVFAWPGLGQLMVTAVSNRDYPLIQGLVLFTAMLFVLINFVTDMICRYLDPRIRL